MEADRWLRIEQLYHQAAALGAADRVAFLAHECAGDQGMRDQLEALLEEDASSGSFLERDARWTRTGRRAHSGTGTGTGTGTG